MRLSQAVRSGMQGWTGASGPQGDSSALWIVRLRVYRPAALMGQNAPKPVGVDIGVLTKAESHIPVRRSGINGEEKASRAECR